MNILSITTQKPHSTGSGTFLTELVRSFDRHGFKQAVVAGITREDRVDFLGSVKFWPVYYNTPELPFPVVGMSDSMPYESTRYCDLTDDMVSRMHEAFIGVIRKAIMDLKPDVILCHHLFLLTSMVRESFPDIKVCCVSHGSDLRQMMNLQTGQTSEGAMSWAGGINEEYISENISKLDMIFALHREQAGQIADLYGVNPDKITVIGSGYNSQIFHAPDQTGTEPKKPDQPVRIVFAGKICREKGIRSLVNAMKRIQISSNDMDFELRLAGGFHDDTISDVFGLEPGEPLPEGEIKAFSFKGKYLGMLSQKELAEEFRSDDIFVLPSFYEGLGLTLIEAMSCGLRTVSNDLPGVREWINSSVPDNDTIFVKAPKMKAADQPEEDSLPAYEKDLADAIGKAMRAVIDDRREGRFHKIPDTSAISWDGVAGKIAEVFASEL